MKSFSTAAILCGGKSSRMGFDKSKIIINGKPLIEDIAERLNNVFDDIVFITNDKNKFNTKYRVVEDEIKGCGPAGAIYTALLNSKSKYVFVVGCDMPFINVDYVKFLIEKMRGKSIECLITKKGNYYEPLYSFYSIDIKDTFKNEIEKGNFRIMDIIKSCKVEFTKDEEVQMFINKYDMFTNLNYLDDINKIKKLGFEYENLI